MYVGNSSSTRADCETLNLYNSFSIPISRLFIISVLSPLSINCFLITYNTNYIESLFKVKTAIPLYATNRKFIVKMFQYKNTNKYQYIP